MQTPIAAPAQLSNPDLLAEIRRLAHGERDATARLVAHLAELEERKLHLAEGYSSLFDYCTGALGMSEDEAFFRMRAARVARQYPAVVDMLAAGSIHLSTIRLVSAHLTAENAGELLAAVAGKTKREVERCLAGRFPEPGPADAVRKLPARRPAPEPRPAAPPSPAIPYTPEPGVRVAPEPRRPVVVAPVAAERYKVAFTIDTATHEKLQKAQDLLRHALPNGDLGAIFDRALTLLVADLEKKKCAATDRPQPSRGGAPGSRSIPAAVRRAVWRRDGGRCAFVAETGKRCAARTLLEFHHVVPFAAGGKGTVDGVEIRCAAHNRFEWEIFSRGQERAQLLFGPGTGSGTTSVHSAPEPP
jgi:hypothetical protein